MLAFSFGVTCPFLYFLHVPCPTCGMTRAVLSLCKGRWSQYIYYNVMALPVCGALVSLLFTGGRKRKWLIWCGTLMVLLLNFAYYAYRLWLYFQCGDFPPTS